MPTVIMGGSGSGALGRGIGSSPRSRRGGSGSLGNSSAASYARVHTDEGGEEGEDWAAYDGGLDEGVGGGVEMRGAGRGGEGGG